jgi:O-antigen/teichoic acid export membrane protein
MTDLPADDASHGMRAPGTAWMIGGSLIGAIAAYLFNALGTRSLGDEAFAPIGALWTTLFVIATIVLVPLEQFATREASRNRNVWGDDRLVWLALIAVGVGLGMAFVWWTDHRFFGGEPVYIYQMGLMMLGYGMLFLGRGILAGQRRFSSVGILLATESVLRLAVAFVILRTGGDAVALGWSMVVGPIMILIVPFWRKPAEAPVGERIDSPARFLAAYASGTTASQILLAASPLAVSFLGGSAALFSVVFVTFTLFRAPLTLIYSLQGRLLSMLVRLIDMGRRRRVRTLSAQIAVGGLGLTVLAWWVGGRIGPNIVSWLFGPEFLPSSQVAGLVAAGMVAASTAQITGQVLVAEGATGRLANAWATGLLLAIIVLVTVDGEPDVVVAGAFALGELAALCMVGFIVLRGHRADRFGGAAVGRRSDSDGPS